MTQTARFEAMKLRVEAAEEDNSPSTPKLQTFKMYSFSNEYIGEVEAFGYVQAEALARERFGVACRVDADTLHAEMGD